MWICFREYEGGKELFMIYWALLVNLSWLEMFKAENNM
jgi:hypothetical protein